MVHADSLDKLFSKMNELLSKMNDDDSELLDTNIDCIKVNDSKMVYCEAMVFKIGDDDEIL